MDNKQLKGGSRTGIGAALLSAVFLGLAPIFGKHAIENGYLPLSVVALRTCFAAGLLLLIMLVFQRKYFYIYPAGLVGCFLAGGINGLGSIFYYMALGSLPASVGQLIYSTYPIFLALWLVIDRQPPGRLTIFRIFCALCGIALLVCPDPTNLNIGGVLMMLVAAALYALHLPINQRVLYDIPAPTVTLYTLLAMSIVVLPIFLLFQPEPLTFSAPFWPIIGLTLVTFFSRLALFLGVKHLGGMQTALLGLSELLVTIIISIIWLREFLEPLQWIGALLLATSMLLVGYERISGRRRLSPSRWLRWLRPPELPPSLPWGSHE